MQSKILIPKAGMGITEGTILKWLKAEGASVSEGEVIAEIEFAKAVQEIVSPATGILTQILLPEGQTADVYTEIAVVASDT